MWPTPPVTDARSLAAVTITAGQCLALVGYSAYGQHHRPMRRSNWLLTVWPTPQESCWCAMGDACDLCSAGSGQLDWAFEGAVAGNNDGAAPAVVAI